MSASREIREGWEIERRFLVTVAPEAWASWGRGTPLRQGYVLAGPRSVRIRSGEPRGAVLNCKSGFGVRRREVEEIVSPAMAEALFAAAEERVIEKTRWRDGGWEIDRFGGPLAGLMLLEIELTDPDDPLPDPPDGVSILREVTDDKRFTSSALASMTGAEQKVWVQRVYEEVGR